MEFFCLHASDQSVLLQQLQIASKLRRSIIFFNSQWSQSEWEQVGQIFGRSFASLSGFDGEQIPTVTLSLTAEIPRPIYFIPTGGTSGKIKFAVHHCGTLSASVAGFRDFFAIDRVDCFCVLPLYHVGGLMQWWRSHLSGGTFLLGDYGALKRGIVPVEDLSNFCISLVPTQLQVLLQVCPGWLRQFRLVLLGGAPAHKSLLQRARDAGISLALTYGMTETASQVVALKPGDFLLGKEATGQVLPHAQLEISEEGIIRIQSQSLFWGYYPAIEAVSPLITDDLGYFDADQYLYLLGRNSQKIISGGENIYPAAIENVLLSTGLLEDVAVLGQRDDYWGERVVAVLVLKAFVTLAQVQGAIADQLSRYQRPKQWLCVDQLPRNAQGKLNQTMLRAMIEKDYG